MKVSEILQVKGNILYTVTPDQPLLDAANTMAEKTSVRWWSWNLATWSAC